MAAAEDIAKGALGLAGPYGQAAGIALQLAPTITGLFTGNAQRRRANAINPVDPGFVANSGILDNKRIVNELYNNFTLPGQQDMMSNLAAGSAGAMAAATQGASSSGDILDAATKVNYTNTQALNQIGVQAATMKQGLLPQVLDANAQAGNEAVRRNQWDELRYQAQLREKAALTQAGAANQFNAFDGLATLGGSLLNYKSQPDINTPPSSYRKKTL